MVHTSDCCLQDMQRRRLLAATLAAGGLLLLPSRSWAGDIRDLVGEVKVNNRKVGKRSSVYPGDTVETGSGAMIAFVVGNDAYVLRENARLELEGGNKDTFARALRLLTGGLLAVFGKSSTTRQLHTQTVTAGIRGTGIYMESEPSRTYFCTCYGAVEFEVAGSGERKLVMSSHHKGGWINQAAQDGTHFGGPVMVGHNDDDLIALESLVGRKPPFLIPANG